MIHPYTIPALVNDHIGLGVFATQKIKKGTIIFVPDLLDRVIKPEDKITANPNYKALIEKYSYVDELGNRILSWDHAKYMNHHCDANTLSTAWGFDITVRDIEKGEELTCEYGLLNIESEMPCSCSFDGCRKIISQSDIKLYTENWDKKVQKTLKTFSWEDQPLKDYLTLEMKHSLSSFLNDDRLYKSVKHLDITIQNSKKKLTANI